MKSVSAFRVSLRFVAVFVLCFAFHCNSAKEETMEGLSHREADDEVSEKHSLPLREERSVKSINATPNLPDIVKRLQAVEKKIEALLSLKPRSSDSWFLAYLLGRDGRNNGKGLPGPPGPPGKPGTSGKLGPKGASGKPVTSISSPGPPGPKGDRGAIGRTGAQGTKGEKGQDGKSGVKYVRWGRTTCPSGAQVVYKGIMGGEHYGHQGGGVNYLCLPHTPKYDKYKDGIQNSGYMYGTEYQVSTFNPFSKKNLHDHDALCVVCFVKSRGSMLMMPARNDCPSGWTEEYHGYLMTEYYNHRKQRDFICVDEDAAYVPGSHANRDGALLYPVQGVCGSLPCLPYVNGRELTCAVCTK